MSTIGLVGGIGPESTMDYYRRILTAWRRAGESGAPHMLIDSLDATLTLRLIEHDRRALGEYIAASIRRLEAGGATLLAITSHTGHLAFEAAAQAATRPVVSLVETAADAAEQHGWKNVILIGTKFTMSSAMYPTTFAARGLDVRVPSGEEQAWLHERYVQEFLKGGMSDSTRAQLTRIVSAVRDRDGGDCVMLGGTELPVVLRDQELAGLPVFDPTDAHVAEIIHRYRAAS